MEFSRQKYWSGLPFPSPGALLNPGMETVCPALQADSLLSAPLGKLLIYKVSFNNYADNTLVLVTKITFDFTVV